MTVPANELTTVPPHDLDIEIALLSALMLDPEKMKTVAPLTAPSDFYSTAHRMIFDAMLDVHQQGSTPDVLLVVKRLRAKERLVEVGGIEYLAKVVSAVSTAANAKHYADALRDLALKREILHLGVQMKSEALNGTVGADTAAKYAGALKDLANIHAPKSAQALKILDDSVPKETPWLIRGFLARGNVSLLSADPKCGKTTLTAALVAALQRGDTDFCGFSMTDPCDSVWLSEESDEALARNWNQAGVDKSRVPKKSRSDCFPRVSLEIVIAEIMDHLSKHPEVGLVVVDTFTFWAQLPDKGGNDRDLVNRTVEMFQEITTKNVAVLLLHHNRKSGGENTQAVSGSNALVGAVDIVLEMTRHGTGSQRVITFSGRPSMPEQPIVVEYKDGAYKGGGTVTVAEKSERDDAVRAWLVAEGAYRTMDDILEGVPGRKQAVMASVKGLAQRQEIVLVPGARRGLASLYGALSTPRPAAPEGAGSDPRAPD